MIQLEPNLDKLTPQKRTERLVGSFLDRNIVDLLLKTRSKLNILRAVKDSLPSLASGIDNYVRFRKLARRPFFPVAEATVKIRPATFNPGKTFKMYLAHIQKACFFLNIPADRVSPSILTIADGIAIAQVRSIQFPNLIRFGDLAQLLKHSPMRGEFGQRAFVSYISPPMVPPEALQLVRAFPNGSITDYKKQDKKPLIGVRTYNNTSLLVIMSAFRKNIRNGRIPIRHCICNELGNSMARAWCPIRAAWPNIQKRVKPSNYIPPLPHGQVSIVSLKRL